MHEKIVEGVFLVGGGHLSGPGDCLCYALDLVDVVLVDSGCGPGWRKIRANIQGAGLDPDGLHTLFLTHCHVDHVGAAPDVQRDTQCRVVAHELDAEAIETGDPERTAASWYGRDLEEMTLTQRISGHEHVLSFPGGEINVLHTPGHTPGSCVAWMDTDGGRVLFGQDIHGPFERSFGSDRASHRQSMQEVLALRADILCEGHYGVFYGSGEVQRFIRQFI